MSMMIDNGTRVNTPTYTPETTVRTDVKPKIEASQVPADATVSQPDTKVTPQLRAEEVQLGMPGQTKEAKPLDEQDNKKLKDAVSHVNQTMKHAKTKCEFSYHEATKRVSIKVIDEDTDEVIHEIPGEEALDMLSKIWEFAGLTVDEKR